MSDIAERYARVDDGFRRRLAEVPDDAWSASSPCEGWTARDVVRHLAEWVPGFFGGTWGLPAPAGPSVDEDPAAAWAGVSDVIRAGLADPAVATAERDSPMGPITYETAVDRILTGDLLIHTWDLARAAGLDEALDADAVHRMLEWAEPMDEMMRQSGMFGPKVDVPADSDEQTRLIAFSGRQP